MSLSKAHLMKLLEDARAKAAASAAQAPAIEATKEQITKPYEAPSIPSTFKEHPSTLAPVTHIDVTKVPEVKTNTSQGMHGESIELNERQQEAVRLAVEGKSFCLTGAAGTGKTTATHAIISALIAAGKIGPLREETKVLAEGSPGCVSIAFTRRAVANIMKAMPDDMKGNCVTHHALLEYEPVYYTELDKNGNEVNTMRFEPTRNYIKPLPSSLRTIIIEESSLYSTELYAELLIALPDPENVQFIFLGDLFQLPPVYGSPILGFKLNELPVVELTHVYRQALESPIIRLAHHVKDGKLIASNKHAEWHVPNQLTIHPWKQKMPDYRAMKAITAWFNQAIDGGMFDVDADIILTPFNKNFGTLEMNRGIANHLGKKRGEPVHEIIAGFEKHYYAIGDKVLVEKNDGIITKIARNYDYTGKRPQVASLTLDRWGTNQNYKEDLKEEASKVDIDLEMASVDDLLDSSVDDIKDRKLQASHTITVKMATGAEIELTTAGAINNMLFGYALTVHKSQGSEWRKVFFVMHRSQANMISRELLYTGITRAREELYIICEEDTFIKGVVSQKIKGTTLAQKAEFFKGKQEEQQRQLQLVLAAAKHSITKVEKKYD